MSVRIRLARIGKKKAPVYRIVAIDKRVKRDGKFLENLGTYNPISGEMVQFHAERVQAWIDKGAIPSDTVVKLQRRFKKGQTAALERVEPIRKQTLSKVELEAQEAAKAPKVEEKLVEESIKAKS
jgi:small subunit ribosomal protein S16